MRREEERDFVQVDVLLTPYERARNPIWTTKQVSVFRKPYEDKLRITGLRKIWSLSPDKIQAMAENARMRFEMVDPRAGFPTSSTPVIWLLTLCQVS